MDVVYANIITISASQSDISMTFRWTVPIYNEKYEVTGQQIAREQIVNMSPATFLSFVKIANKTSEEIAKSIPVASTEKQ